MNNDPSIWLHPPFDAATRAEVKRLMDEDPKALADAFSKDLSFGTGGMRGIMGVGTNRMNIYTIRRATQGLANYLTKGPDPVKVFVGFDVRLHAPEFALETARVLIGNGIDVLLAVAPTPTPLVSFACRYYGCSGAVMITASHNPPEYNGYKVYSADGGQVVFPHDTGIMAEVAKVISFTDIPLGDPSQITKVGFDLDEAYFSMLRQLRFDVNPNASSLKIVYTPLHGTGLRLMPKALAEWGFSHLELVESQAAPDGRFPNAPKPNPEEASALKLGIEQLQRNGGDLLIATDPDADRVGVVASGGVMLSGHQVGSILLDHICQRLLTEGRLPDNGACIKSIVTSELFRKIASLYGIACFDVLTGFKYIGEKIHEWEQSFGGYQYIFGAEESYGYLYGTSVRDKDAISSACLIADAAEAERRRGRTLVDALHDLFRRHGVHAEALLNIVFEDTQEKRALMQEAMRALRHLPPTKVGDIAVIAYEDYEASPTPLNLPKSDVVRLWLEDGSKVVFRPSGTEPKLKIYIEVVEPCSDDLALSIQQAQVRLKKLSDEARAFFTVP
ncbi:MAG: putative phosphoglucomutase/phosphomannomutase [Chlamydiota bacterium]|jgi:phosphoglucomutase/phosphomannomutase